MKESVIIRDVVAVYADAVLCSGIHLSFYHVLLACEACSIYFPVRLSKSSQTRTVHQTRCVSGICLLPDLARSPLYISELNASVRLLFSSVLSGGNLSNLINQAIGCVLVGLQLQCDSVAPTFKSNYSVCNGLSKASIISFLKWRCAVLRSPTDRFYSESDQFQLGAQKF